MPQCLASRPNSYNQTKQCAGHVQFTVLQSKSKLRPELHTAPGNQRPALPLNLPLLSILITLYHEAQEAPTDMQAHLFCGPVSINILHENARSDNMLIYALRDLI